MPHLEIDNFAMAISLVASTRGVALLPASAENFLKWSVISRPLKGEAPTIDLVIGYHKANTSPLLERFLSRSRRTSGEGIAKMAAENFITRATSAHGPADIGHKWPSTGPGCI